MCCRKAVSTYSQHTCTASPKSRRINMSERDRIPVQNVPASKAGTALYTKREAIYVKHITAIFQQGRDLTVIATLGVFFCLPWVQRAGRPAGLFGLPRRQFHISAVTFWPED